MSGTAILRAARAAGLDLRVDGDGLVLQANAPPPQEILNNLARYKREILDLLRPDRHGWSAEDWQVHFDERAGIAEFDGGMPRREAEARAFECCVVEWLTRTCKCSSPERCRGWGDGDHANGALAQHGVKTTCHLWLPTRCWSAWHADRKAEAVAALKAMGIVPPVHFPDDFVKTGGA